MPADVKIKEKNNLFDIFDQDGIKRNTEEIKKICADVGISMPTYYAYKKEYIDSKEEYKFDISKALQRDESKIYQALMAKVTDRNAKSINDALRMLTELKRGQESKGELTPNDYTNLAIRTRDALREEFRQSNGVCPVCLRPKILLEEPSLHSEQEHSPNSEVGIVELSPSTG